VKKLFVLAIAVVVVCSGLITRFYVYAIHQQTNSPPNDLNVIVKSKLQNAAISVYTIESHPYKSFSRPLAINGIMKGFYSLENESVFKEYYSVGWKNLSISFDVVYADYNNTTDPYGLHLVKGIFTLQYILQSQTSNGTVQPELIHYVEFDINAGTSNVTGPEINTSPVSYSS